MSSSAHYYLDSYGNIHQITVIHDDIDEFVVFESIPPLAFDLKSYGLRPYKRNYVDYSLTYIIEDNSLYLVCIQGKFKKFPFISLPVIFEKSPNLPFPNKRIAVYQFKHLMTDYTGTLKIGKDFKMHLWPKDDKASPVPNGPEAYYYNGTLRIENGIIVEKNLYRQSQQK